MHVTLAPDLILKKYFTNVCISMRHCRGNVAVIPSSRSKQRVKGRLLVKLLPDTIILALSKMNTFADRNFIVAQMVQFVFVRLENIVEKGENTDYQHFLLFSQGFQKAAFGGIFKTLDCWMKG